MTAPGKQTAKEEIARQLTASQRKAVFHVEGPLLVIAGPGSGKTRVITYRIAALIDSGINPRNICAITFTNKAAEQMRQRAATLGASAGAHISTFHSLCVRILRRYANRSGISANFSIYDAADQKRCVKRAIVDCDLNTTNFSPARMLDAISTLKNKLLDADTFAQQADDYFSKVLAKIYLCYQHILKENNALDFDDLLMDAAVLLESCPDVCLQLSNHFKFLLIDEYQDTNHAQYRLAKALVSQHNNICATGDPDQSIYRWRGADIRNILAFEHDWPDAVVVKLEENFRSTPNILTVADNLIAQNENRKQKRLIPTREAAADVSVNAFEDETEEAAGVARQIKELIAADASTSDIAVFYRVNAQSRALEEALIKNRIPYQIVRGVEFYSRKEIRDILAYLKVIANPGDEIALLRIINTPARGIGKTTIDRIRDYAAKKGISVFDALKNVQKIATIGKNPAAKTAAFAKMMAGFRKKAAGKVAPLTEKIFADSGLEESLKAQGAEGENAIENINELISAAAEYDRQAEELSLVDFLQQISLFSDADVYDPACRRVPLMTLHTAKGLEFDNVFIVGVEDGLLPHERSSENEDETEEERRLFFVGITRAKTNLCISYARYRKIRGMELRTVPSQFLFELGLDFTGAAFESAILNEQSSVINNQLSPRFRRGDLVAHRKFGLGTVKDFTDMGENSIVVVEFNGGQTKSLKVKYARLTKM